MKSIQKILGNLKVPTSDATLKQQISLLFEKIYAICLHYAIMNNPSEEGFCDDKFSFYDWKRKEFGE